MKLSRLRENVLCLTSTGYIGLYVLSDSILFYWRPVVSFHINFNKNKKQNKALSCLSTHNHTYILLLKKEVWE